MVECNYRYYRNTYFKIGLEELFRKILYITSFKILTHAFKHEALVRKKCENNFQKYTISFTVRLD